MSDRVCDVVIATRNRPVALARCLEGLAAQTFTDFGVVIVDDCSDESLAPIVEAADPSLATTFVRMPQQVGPAEARNAGVAASHAEYVVFIDDDVVADKRLIGVHLAAVRSGGPDDLPIVSYGPFVQPEDWVPTPWNLWEARQAKKEADAMTLGHYTPTWRQFHTGNNCVPTELFRRVGGFNSDFKRAEDDEFALRLEVAGCQFRFTPAALAWHYSNRSAEAFLSIPRSYARFDVLIDRLHPGHGYLDAKRDELGRRRWPLRVVRRLLSGPRRTAAAVNASTWAATQLYDRGAVELPMQLLSVAYDLSYVDALDQALAAEPDGAAC